MKRCLLAGLLCMCACSPAGVTRVVDGWQKTPVSGPLSRAPDAVLDPSRAPWSAAEASARIENGPVLLRMPVRPGPGRAVYLPLTPFSMRSYCGGHLLHSHSDEQQFKPGGFLGWTYHIIDTRSCTDGWIYFHVYTGIPMRFVVPHEGARSDVIRYIIANSLGQFIVIVVCFSLAVGFLIPMVRGDLMSGSLSLFLFCTGVWLFALNPVSRLFIRDVPAWSLFCVFCLFLSPAGVTLFVRSILPEDVFWPARSLALWFLAFALTAAALDAAGLFAVYRAILPFNLMAIGFAGLGMVQVLRGIRGGSVEPRIFALGTAVLLLFAIHDMVLVFSAASGVLELRVSRLHFGMLGFVLSMAGVAAYRWHTMQRALESYSRDLEKRVQDRTAHLEEALAEVQAADARMKEELAIASGIQRQLLQPLPVDLPGLRFHGRYIPMHDVSGDFYDIFSADGRQAVFLFADATGHGVPAALLMSMLKAIFIESAPLFDDPSWILAHMNNRLEKNLARTGNYVTASVVILNEDGTALYSNAGQRPCALLSPGKQLQWIDAEGLILGAFPQQPEDYAVVRFRLEAGERLVFYSDGVTECEGPGGHFDETLLGELLSREGGLESDALLTRIVDRLEEVRGGQGFQDDVSLCVIDRIRTRP